ncbi:MAG: hypothetical protein A2V88_10810 [Elusimicrobia bacterium RBG_16_66_12]|nr:MAG: hypothetical protein A2V88_10810 [Elusimicrobia bacterium RBG_16_66_12]
MTFAARVARSMSQAARAGVVSAAVGRGVGVPDGDVGDMSTGAGPPPPQATTMEAHAAARERITERLMVPP